MHTKGKGHCVKEGQQLNFISKVLKAREKGNSHIILGHVQFRIYRREHTVD